MNTPRNNQPEMIMCGACSAAMYLYEMKRCGCGRLVHAGCVTNGECRICANDNPVGSLLEYIMLAVN